MAHIYLFRASKTKRIWRVWTFTVRIRLIKRCLLLLLLLLPGSSWPASMPRIPFLHQFNDGTFYQPASTTERGYIRPPISLAISQFQCNNQSMSNIQKKFDHSQSCCVHFKVTSIWFEFLWQVSNSCLTEDNTTQSYCTLLHSVFYSIVVK